MPSSQSDILVGYSDLSFFFPGTSYREKNLPLFHSSFMHLGDQPWIQLFSPGTLAHAKHSPNPTSLHNVPLIVFANSCSINMTNKAGEKTEQRGSSKQFQQQTETTPAEHGASPSPLIRVSCKVRLPGCCDVHVVCMSVQSLQPWVLWSHLQHFGWVLVF